MASAKVIGIRKTGSDITMDTLSTALVVLSTIIFLYPVYYVFIVSFSSAESVMARDVWLFPIGINLHAYELAFDHEYLIPSFFNSILYSVTGTVYSVLLTIFGAYALAHRQLRGRNFFMFLIFFTMLFGGGLIPTYLLVKDLQMTGTIWSMIIPCAISQWNLIVMRTVFQSNPESLEESAKIDGANYLQILFRIIIPISTPVIATITLLYFVGKWNDYFSALIYLTDKRQFPLQLVARELLVSMSDQLLNRSTFNADPTVRASFTPQAFRSAIIVITVAPMMVIYPFLQKYFVKGIIIGAVKG